MSKVSHLVGRWVFAETNVPVDTEYDVLDGQLRDCLVDIDDAERGGFDERLPIFERSPIFPVMRCRPVNFQPGAHRDGNSHFSQDLLLFAFRSLRNNTVFL